MLQLGTGILKGNLVIEGLYALGWGYRLCANCLTGCRKGKENYGFGKVTVSG
jgi:hypothetical protein